MVGSRVLGISSRVLFALALTGLLTGALARTAAAQLVNDECSGALPVVEGVTSGSTNAATKSPVTGSCAPVGKDVWFDYVPQQDGLLVASLVDGGGTADFDTVLTAFSGGCGGLVEEACNDDSGSLASKLALVVTSGTTYYLELGGFSGDSGAYDLALSLVPGGPPANDTCAGALPVGIGLVSGETFFAGTDPVTPACAIFGAPATNDVWFLYTAPADGVVNASLVTGGGSADFDTVMAAYVGPCNLLEEIACNDDAGGFFLASEVQFAVTAGSEYRIAVAGYAGSTGSFTLAIDQGVLPDNDECATAMTIGLGAVEGQTIFASDSQESGTCALGGLPVTRDVWYRYLAPGAGVLGVATAESGGGSADFDTAIALFKGGCGALEEVICNDDSAFSLQSKLAYPVEAGDEFLIAVGGVLGASGHFTLNLELLGPPLLSNVVLDQAKISDTAGGFDGDLSDGFESFGASVAALGDLDGDGTTELAVGSPYEGLTGEDAGAVWILFLRRDGSVKSWKRLATASGGLPFATGHTRFGAAVAALGDLDGDGLSELAVGAPDDDVGGPDRGALWVLFLAADGGVKSTLQIGSGLGGFGGAIGDGDAFGSSLARLGDLDGDGVTELAVGAPFNDNGGEDRGAAWILFLAADGTVAGWQRISDTSGTFTGPLSDTDLFGISMAGPGDLDGDGLVDLAVGAVGDDDGGTDRGAVWLLHLKTDGKVASWDKLGGASDVLGTLLAGAEELGRSLTVLPDADGDGHPELLAGATGDSDGGPYHGAVWLLRLDAHGKLKSLTKISAAHGGFGGVLGDNAFFGEAVTCLGDLDGDGRDDLAVGNRYDDDGALDRGAVWILFLDAADTWVDAGYALGGALGTPHLAGHGELLGDGMVTLSLEGAAASAPAMVVLGESAGMQPMHGGMLVPAPDTILFPYVTDGVGALEVGGRWPTDVDPGLSWWFQAWILDATAMDGFAASNAVVAQTP